MIYTAWRIVKTKHVGSAFSGYGAREGGGRWNNLGTGIVYCAESRSLAALELLVHLPADEVLHDFSIFMVEIPDGVIEQCDLSQLPPDWRSDPISPRTRTMGDEWAKQLRSAALRVPSAITPEEFNYLLNPTHVDFAQVRIGTATKFSFDPRLIKPR